MNTPRVFHLEGMHCGSCVARITAHVKQHPLVETVTVDLAGSKMEVRADSSVSDDAITALVAAAGDYGAPRYFLDPYRPAARILGHLPSVADVDCAFGNSTRAIARRFADCPQLDALVYGRILFEF
jgi:copper chaperone CopZ